MIARLRDYGPALVDAYLAKETRNGVTFIARDAAKRLFPEYKQDPVNNNRNSDRAASLRWQTRYAAPSCAVNPMASRQPDPYRYWLARVGKECRCQTGFIRKDRDGPRNDLHLS